MHRNDDVRFALRNPFISTQLKSMCIAEVLQFANTEAAINIFLCHARDMLKRCQFTHKRRSLSVLERGEHKIIYTKSQTPGSDRIRIQRVERRCKPSLSHNKFLPLNCIAGNRYLNACTAYACSYRLIY